MSLSGCKVRWNYTSKTVSSVATKKNELLTGFETIVNDTDRYGFSTIASAENCINTLKDDKFNFWLNIFSELMPQVDILYNVMQCTGLTVQRVEKYLNDF